MEAAFSNIPISEKLKTYSLVCIYLAVNSLLSLNTENSITSRFWQDILLYFSDWFLLSKIHFKEFFYKTAFSWEYFLLSHQYLSEL
jgi:hypothetical protein